MVDSSRVRVRGSVVAVTALVCVLAGCASSGGAPSRSIDPFFVDLLAEARAAGAGEAQIAVLEDATVNGEVTYNQAETQLAEYFTCLEQIGLEPVRWEDKVTPSGYRIPAYSVGLGFEDADVEPALALLNACYTTHYRFADIARQVQPTAIEAENADIEAHRADILACIAEHGGSADAESTTDELVNAVLEVGDRTGVWCYQFG